MPSFAATDETRSYLLEALPAEALAPEREHQLAVAE